MISLVNVTKRYKGKRGYNYVIDDISLDFPRGVNVGIVGGNGAGKSTFLRLLGGAEEPTRGKVYRHGTVSWPLGFGGVFQGSLSGINNVRFIARIYNKDLRKVIKFVREFTELGERLEMPVSTFSSGMRAKFNFAISMAIDFDFYLIDELTAVGDSSFRNKCKMEFDKRRERSTIIIVSHQTGTIRQYCDIVMILKDGKLTPYADIEEGIKTYEGL